MSAIADAFARCDKRAALITFITAGFPYADSTPLMLHAMANAGADILEVGVPFSDPMADGAAIQRASERALANGMTPAKTLADIAVFRADNDTPVVLMGYTNSFMNACGDIDDFAVAAADAGVSGLIVVDLADTERGRWRRALNTAEVEMINLTAPTTEAARLQTLASESQGFVYVISLKGVTGAAHIAPDSLKAHIAAVKQHTQIPVAAGFGVRTAAQAQAVADIADGVVVGSRLVEAVEAAADFNADFNADSAADSATSDSADSATARCVEAAAAAVSEFADALKASAKTIKQ